MSPLKIECDRNLALGEPAKLKLEVNSFSICCELIPRKYRNATWGRDMTWYLHAGDSLTKQPGWREFSTNQKHYPGQGSDMSSVWNFCVRSSGVISRETVLVKCRLFSQAAPAENCLRGIEVRTRKGCSRCLACIGGGGADPRMLEQVSKLPSLASTLLACVASVCNQVIARKLEREQKKGGRGRGIHFFFSLLSQLSRRTSRANACYAG